MPFHILKYTYPVDVYHPCTCSTGDVCECDPCEFLWTEYRLVESIVWFNYGEPNPGWKPSWSLGFPVPEKAPRVVNFNYGLRLFPALRCATLQIATEPVRVPGSLLSSSGEDLRLFTPTKTAARTEASRSLQRRSL